MIQNLFVYGTLAPGRPNEHILQHLQGSWQPAIVIGSLQNKGWGAELGYPAIVLSTEGEDIQGFLFSSEGLTNFWPTLDEFEGQAYERIITNAKLENENLVETYIYALKSS